ncbi:MAG TPA: branched-chain amino acid ABC transporter ATP-binding protein/permease [Chloroflexia bacterium]|nr:branched-chain amino acid ABC transporter ATP-binding protein/permease [Chloroflexia bacterium]
MTELDLKLPQERLDKGKKQQGFNGVALPLWVKDYAGIGLLALLLYGGINFYANDTYYLQILCSIGVAVIVATGLNLIVGYIGQVALGHAGFVALGGYVVGLILGRITGKTNWIDYLYVRKLAAYDPDEQRDPVRATAARNASLDSTNNLIMLATVGVVIVTVVLGVFLYIRWQQVKRSGGIPQRHFWNNAPFMKLLTRAILGIGVAGGLILFVATAVSQAGNAPGKEQGGLPWVVFANWAVISLILYYLSERTYRRVSQDTGRLRVSFWDRPQTVKTFFLLVVITGALLTVAGLVFRFVGLWTLQNFWVVLVLGAALAAAFGWVLALPALRVKGPYLSMVTIAFGTIVYEVVNSTTLQPILGSQAGLGRIPYPMTQRSPQTDMIYPVLDKNTQMVEFFWTAIIIATIALVAVYVVRSFMRTRWGRSLIAIRENEIGAASVGINVTRSKTLAFVISAALSGVAGVLLAYSFSSIDPSFTILSVSISYVTMLILGGSGTLFGPVLGAILITIIPEFLKNITTDKSLARYVFAFENINGYLTPFLLLALVVAILVLRRSAAMARYAQYLMMAAGVVVILNSYEIFKSLTLALGSINGIGFARTTFDISDWLLIGFFYVMIVAGLVFTTSAVRKIAVRTVAACFILFIPSFFKLGYGFAKNSDASNFQAVTTLLTMYGAILLYFLYLVPNGVGGLIGKFIERYLPTSHRINYRRLQGQPVASADGGGPQSTVTTSTRRTLAFHREETSHEQGVLRVAQVSRNFKGLRAVDSVEMELKTGTVHALIGPNGAGKTTVLNLISGLYPVSAGEILFKGERIDGLKAHRIAESGISRTFQNLQVFGDMTVIENVMVGFHLHTRQSFLASLLGLPQVRAEEQRIEALAMELLQFVGLEDRAYHRAKDLPYGYQRLLEIARALAVEPQVLLLDEPAAGLNPSEVDEMVRLIRKIKAEGVTVLLIEHHMDLVMEISDEVTVLDYGRKIEEGSPGKVQNSPRVKEAYFGPEVVLDARS